MQDFPDRRSLVTLPVLIAALFGASLAIVEVRRDTVRYRRLFKWKTIPKDDIVNARVVWGPFIGSMRLKRFVFPWGRLYFVLDAVSDPNPFHRGEFPLVRYLRKEPILEAPAAAESTTRAKLRQVIAAVAGALFSGLWQLFYSWRFSEFEPPRPAHPPGSVAIEIMRQISEVLTSFEVACIGFVVFTLLAIYKYRQRDAWIYAFLAGMALPRILLHWL
jgi:hypothetical protein